MPPRSTQLNYQAQADSSARLLRRVVRGVPREPRIALRGLDVGLQRRNPPLQRAPLVRVAREARGHLGVCSRHRAELLALRLDVVYLRLEQRLHVVELEVLQGPGRCVSTLRYA
jgi:hypothetical protein